MIKDYCKATILWRAKTDSGYGPTYAAPVTVENVYFEKNIKLTRGQDSTSKSDAIFFTFENAAYMVGDQIEYAGRKYTIMSVSEFYKPRSVVFDHIECDLTEIYNG